MKINNCKWCIHCNKKIEEFKKIYFVESSTDLHNYKIKKYICKKCLKKYLEKYKNEK